MEEELKGILSALHTTNGKSNEVIANLHNTIAQASQNVATLPHDTVTNSLKQPVLIPEDSTKPMGGRAIRPHQAGPNGEIVYR